MARKAKSITTITDPILDPYFITKDDHCYTVNVKVESDKDHFRSKGKSKTYSKSISYHARFDQALRWISDEQLHIKKKLDLNEFLTQFKNIRNNIKEYTDGIRSTI
jgi:hypothetical protein|tara:strand:- start:453 stop:770 length:318 start_codon:yes stop_codon:yes gene_type:complete